MYVSVQSFVIVFPYYVKYSRRPIVAETVVELYRTVKFFTHIFQETSKFIKKSEDWIFHTTRMKKKIALTIATISAQPKLHYAKRPDKNSMNSYNVNRMYISLSYNFLSSFWIMVYYAPVAFRLTPTYEIVMKHCNEFCSFCRHQNIQAPKSHHIRFKLL